MSQNSPRKRSTGKQWIPGVLLAVVIVGAALGTYALLNEGRMPWSTEAQAQAKVAEDRAGKKSYPRAMQSIPPFTAVTLEHIVDAKGVPNVLWLDAEKAQANGLLEASAVLGRVTKGDKRAGYGFTEADFLPKGSPASRTAAIPAGMVGVQLTAQQIPTLRGLEANDRFVLVAAADPYSGPLAPRGTTLSTELQSQAAERKAFNALTRLIVEGGVVSQAMHDTKSNSKDQAFVAVPSAQYGELLSALNNEVEITALAESTNPTVEVVRLPEPVVPEPVESITIQNGNEKRTFMLPPEKSKSGGSR